MTNRDEGKSNPSPDVAIEDELLADGNGVEDAEELEMLRSFENGEWKPVPNHEAELERYREMARVARATGNYGPVPYDVPYPWSKKGKSKEQLPVDGADGDDPSNNDPSISQEA